MQAPTMKKFFAVVENTVFSAGVEAVTVFVS